MLPDLARWRIALPSVRFVIISRGDAAAHDAHHLPPGSVLLLQRDREVATAYQCHGTPGAVLIRSDGTIASPVAMGADAIRALVTPWLGEDRRRLPHAPLSLGDLAPNFALPDMEGQTRSLSDFRGREVLIVFWNPGCGFCAAMLSRLTAWAAQRPNDLDLLLVTTAPFVAPDLRALVLLAPDFNTAGSFGASGTPSGILITREGSIGTPILAGETRIFDALEDTLAGAA